MSKGNIKTKIQTGSAYPEAICDKCHAVAVAPHGRTHRKCKSKVRGRWVNPDSVDTEETEAA